MIIFYSKQIFSVQYNKRFIFFEAFAKDNVPCTSMNSDVMRSVRLWKGDQFWDGDGTKLIVFGIWVVENVFESFLFLWVLYIFSFVGSREGTNA